ncbi:MAG: hypothetical protein U5R46_16485 [Gammaproteobacteria bacterium]|nr:hypothetical protein [Gammaproteobacteria bacterium]
MRNNKFDHFNHRKPYKATRRAFLASTMALPFVPATWTAPIVQSVLLPAHAQTSPSCPASDVIPGREFTCEDSNTCVQFRYSLEEGCLVREDGSCTAPSPEASGVRMEFTNEEPAANFTNLLEIEISTDSGNESTSIACDATGVDGTESSEHQLGLDVEGVPYVATFIIGSRDEPDLVSVFVSDITVAPA